MRALAPRSAKGMSIATGVMFCVTSAIAANPDGYVTEVVAGYLVTAPNGKKLWTKIIRPRLDLYPGQTFPSVVDVPGGLGAGENGDLRLAAEGFVEFHVNAEGRGLLHRSEGSENHNGFLHQDDLKAVIEFALTQPNVRTDNLGVVTHSYGITIGAACLGRYPTLKVKYLVEGEGPSDNYVTSFEPWALDNHPENDRHQAAYQIFGHWSTYRDPSPENVAWWSEREATRFIGRARCRYVRVQAEWDHAQPPNAQWPGFDYPPLWWPCKHATDLINLATEGRCAWTRVNAAALGNAANQTYDHDGRPTYYSGRMQDHPDEIQRIIREMAAMPALSTRLGDLNCDQKTDNFDIDPFVLALTDRVAYAKSYPGCNRQNADCNDDGAIDNFDIDPFVDLLAKN